MRLMCVVNKVEYRTFMVSLPRFERSRVCSFCYEPRFGQRRVIISAKGILRWRLLRECRLSAQGECSTGGDAIALSIMSTARGRCTRIVAARRLGFRDQASRRRAEDRGAAITLAACR